MHKSEVAASSNAPIPAATKPAIWKPESFAGSSRVVSVAKRPVTIGVGVADGVGVVDGVGATKGAKLGSVTTLPATTAADSVAGGTPAAAATRLHTDPLSCAAAAAGSGTVPET